MMKATMNMIKKFTAMVLAIAAMAAMMLAPTANAAETTDVEALINEMAAMVNEARIEAGLDPIYVLPYLNEVAEMRAIETVINFDGSRRNGNTYEAEIDVDVVNYRKQSSEKAFGAATAEEAFAALKANKKQWAAMMSGNITHMGIGLAYDEETAYGWCWEQILVETDMEFADQYIPAAENNAAVQIHGDINGDGIVNTYDYLILVEYLTGRGNIVLSEAQLETADCYQDGIITEADAKVMAQFILGECESLPYIF